MDFESNGSDCALKRVLLALPVTVIIKDLLLTYGPAPHYLDGTIQLVPDNPLVYGYIDQNKGVVLAAACPLEVVMPGGLRVNVLKAGAFIRSDQPFCATAWEVIPPNRVVVTLRLYLGRDAH